MANAHDDSSIPKNDSLQTTLLDKISDMVTVSDRDGRIVFANAATERITGYAPREFEERHPFESIHPDDLTRCEAAFAELVENPGLKTEIEHRIRCRNGEWRWVGGVFESFLHDPEVGGILATVREITARKSTEEALREGEERQAFLLGLSDALRPLNDPRKIAAEATRLLGEQLRADRTFLTEVESDGVTLHVRDEYLRSGAFSVLGRYSFDQFGEFVSREMHAGRTLAVEDVSKLTGLNAAERENYAASGIAAYLLVPLVRGGRLAAYFTVNHRTARRWSATDRALVEQTAERTWTATERARAEEALRESEERQAFLLKLNDTLRPLADPAEIQAVASRLLGEELGANRVCYAEMEPDENRLVINRDFAEGVASVRGRYLLTDFGQSTASTLRKNLVLAVNDVHTDPDMDETERRAFDAISVRAHLEVPFVKNGKLRAIIGVHQTEPREWSEKDKVLALEMAERIWEAVERARAEEALVASEEKYRTLFETIDEGVTTLEVVLDENGRAIDAINLESNSAYERLTGLSRAVVVGKSALEYLPDLEQDWFNVYDRIIATGESERLELKVGGLDGQWFDFHMSRIGDDGSRTLVCVFNNVTERKRAEANLAFLAEISQDLVQMSRPEEALEILGAKIGAHFDIVRASFVEIHENQQTATVREWHRPELSSIAGEYPLAQFLGEPYRKKSRAGETVVIPDAHQTSLVDGQQLEEVFGVVSFINVPLVRNGQWIFTLGIHDAVPREWTKDEIELIEELTTRIWTRLERARAEEALRESEERQAFLLTLADRLRQLDDETRALSISTRSLGERLKADRVGYAEDRDGEIHVLFDHVNGVPSLVGRYHYDDYGPDLLKAFRKGRSVVRPDIANDPDLTATEKEAHARLQLGATVNVPLLVNGKLKAVFFLHFRRAHTFDERELALFYGLAEQTWSAVQRIRAETTLRESEARQRFLLELSDTLRPLGNATDIEREATRMLGEALGTNRIFYATIEADGDTGVIRSDYVDGIPSGVGLYSISAFASEFVSEWRAGRTITTSDVDSDPRFTDEERAAYASVSSRSAVGVPLVKGGRLAAIIGVNHSSPREWTDQELTLISEVSSRIWETTERARAEEILQISEERLRTLVEQSPLAIHIFAPDGASLRSNRAWRILWSQETNEAGDPAEQNIFDDERLAAMGLLPYLRDGANGKEAVTDPMLYDPVFAGLGGESKWLRAFVYPVQNGNNGDEVKQVVLMLQDATDSKMRAEERNRAVVRDAAIRAEKLERERISRELHDRVAHSLGVAHQSLELYKALVASNPERAEEKLDMASQITRDVLNQTRNLAIELRRSVAEEVENGLKLAVENMLETLVPDDIHSRVRFAGNETSVPNEVSA